MYLHFATVIEDFERVVEHYIMEEQWSKAIDTLNGQVNVYDSSCLSESHAFLQRDLELYYRFASVLIYQVPKETVD